MLDSIKAVLAVAVALSFCTSCLPGLTAEVEEIETKDAEQAYGSIHMDVLHL